MKFIEVLVEVLMLVFSHKTAFKEVDLCFNTNQVKHFLNTIVHEYCQVYDCMNSFQMFDQVTDCPSKVLHSGYA